MPAVGWQSKLVLRKAGQGFIQLRPAKVTAKTSARKCTDGE